MQAKYNYNILTQTRFGQMLVNPNDIYIGQALIKFGEYSWAEITLLEQLITPSSTVVEAGSNIGSHSIPLAQRLYNDGQLIVFEAQRLVFQQLCANIALNQLTNVTAYWAAVDNTTQGHVSFVDPSPYYANNFGGVSSNTEGSLVKKMSIDSLKLTQCQLIKIDVEGMEIEVLQGATKTIEQHRPFIYFEADRKENNVTIFTFLENLGYELWWDFPRLVSNETLASAPFKPDDSHQHILKTTSLNVIAAPKEKKLLVKKLKPVDDFDYWPPDDRAADKKDTNNINE